MIRRPPRSTLSPSSAASDVYKRQLFDNPSYVEKIDEDKRNEELEELKNEITQIDINNLTPLKALNILQELKEFINNLD